MGYESKIGPTHSPAIRPNEQLNSGEIQNVRGKKGAEPLKRDVSDVQKYQAFDGTGELFAKLQTNRPAENGHGEDAKAAASREMNQHLISVLSAPAASDGVLTWSELVDLARRLDDPSAKWLVQNPDVFKSFPTKTGRHGQVGIDVALAKERLARQPLPPPPPPQSGTLPGTPPVTDRSPSNGTPAPVEGGGSPPVTGTPKQPGPSPTENYDKIGSFSSTATTSEGRMADGLDFLQRGTLALQDDLLKASTENPPNQAKIALIQHKLSQVQNALTAMMQMMKQFQEMMSNMSKMYSEMAMSSIRNMR